MYICCVFYSGKESMRSHMKCHTGIKPFRCDKCSMTFSHRSQLKEHLPTHVNQVSIWICMSPLPVLQSCIYYIGYCEFLESYRVSTTGSLEIRKHSTKNEMDLSEPHGRHTISSYNQAVEINEAMFAVNINCLSPTILN